MDPVFKGSPGQQTTIVAGGNNGEFLSVPIPFYGDVEVQLIGQEELYLGGTLYVSVSISAQIMWPDGMVWLVTIGYFGMV